MLTLEQVLELLDRARVLGLLDSLRAEMGDDVGAPKPTVKDLWEAYAAADADNHRDWQTECSRAVPLLEFFAGCEAASLRLEDIDAYRQARKRAKTRYGRPPSPATRNREIALLRHVLNWAVKRRRLTSNPIWGVKLEDERNIRQTAPTEEEIERIAREAPDHVGDMIRLARCTGMRRDEVRCLRKESVRLEEGIAYLGADQTKNGSPRRVVLTQAAIEIIRPKMRWPSDYVFGNPETGRPYAVSTVAYHFQRAVAASGVRGVAGERVRLHDTRHAFIRDSRREGIPESTIMKIVGHKTRAAFARYDISDDSDMEMARAKLELRAAKRRGPQRSHGVAEKKIKGQAK